MYKFRIPKGARELIELILTRCITQFCHFQFEFALVHTHTPNGFGSLRNNEQEKNVETISIQAVCILIACWIVQWNQNPCYKLTVCIYSNSDLFSCCSKQVMIFKIVDSLNLRLNLKAWSSFGFESHTTCLFFRILSFFGVNGICSRIAFCADS